MFETITISLFVAGLLICIIFNFSILYALLFGYALFFIYGLINKHSGMRIIKMSLQGIKTVKNILIIFVLIGILTAVWRASGTIPFIIYYSAKLIIPEAFSLITFLLCCALSVLTGTAFGTAATIGVICMAMANAMGTNPVLVGGAILSGVYFGDRCSPMSTSAILVGELTKTNIFENIQLMIRTSIVPFIITCGLYLLFGFFSKSGQISSSIEILFSQNFNLHWTTVLPAALIIVLSLAKVNVKVTMILSILLGSATCIFVQGMDFHTLIEMYVYGYHSSDAQLSAMLNGGGIVSMLKVSAIVCLSSSYAGIFDGTGLLDGLKKWVGLICQKITPFGGMAITSVITGMVACNQTLTIMLTNQLCKEFISDKSDMAIALENTAVVVAPLIPWSIAGAVPIATVSAPTICILASCYLYILPIWNFCRKVR